MKISKTFLCIRRNCDFDRGCTRHASPSSLRISGESPRHRPLCAAAFLAKRQLRAQLEAGFLRDLSRQQRERSWQPAGRLGQRQNNDSDSVGIAYRGPALASRRRYYWKVRVWDASGQAPSRRESAWWEMGLLHPPDWKAKVDSLEESRRSSGSRRHSLGVGRGQTRSAVVPKTTATFRIHVQPSRDSPRDAVLFLATRGDFVATVNGHEVDKKERWGAFDRRDITEQLVPGTNSVEVRVTSPEAPEYGPNGGAKTTMAALAALVKDYERQGFGDARSAQLRAGKQVWKIRRSGSRRMSWRDLTTKSWATRGPCRSLPPTCGVRSAVPKKVAKRKALRDRSWQLPCVFEWQARWQRCPDARVHRLSQACSCIRPTT